MNWILCGFKGCGKTYFGKRMGLPFIDTDILIEKREGLTPYAFVQKNGEQVFRQVEEEIITSLDVENHIISVGGGSVFSPSSLSHLQKLGTLIYLDCPKKILKSRLFASPSTLAQDFEKLYSTRISEYERIASHHILLEGKTDTQVLEELWQVINLETSFG